MMKDTTHRKRTRQEMEDVKEFEQSLKQDRQQFLQETKRLRQERDQMQEQIIELSQGMGGMQQRYRREPNDADENDGMQNLGGQDLNEMFNI